MGHIRRQSMASMLWIGAWHASNGRAMAGPSPITPSGGIGLQWATQELCSEANRPSPATYTVTVPSQRRRRTSTLSLSGIPKAHDRSVSMRWTTPRRRHRNRQALRRSANRTSSYWLMVSRARSISSGNDVGETLVAAGFPAKLARVFHFSSGSCAGISDYDAISSRTLDYTSSIQNLGGGVRLRGTSRGILRGAKPTKNGAGRPA